MAGGNDEHGTRRILARIAQTLDVPLETFLTDPITERGASAAAEEAELLAVFRGLRDPGDRRRCIELVRAVAVKVNGRRATT